MYYTIYYHQVILKEIIQLLGWKGRLHVLKAEKAKNNHQS
jgi:hypothetical protein